MNPRKSQRPNKNLTKKPFLFLGTAGALKIKKQDLEILIKNKNPMTICLQELKLKKDPYFELTNYSFIFKNLILQPDEIAHGGVGIFIRKDIPYVSLDVNSNFQLIAIQIFIPKKVTICNIYIHDKTNFSENDLKMS